MKILIISGFLGAGKTTFIQELVKRTHREIAVLENEYGAEGLDKSILENGLTAGDVNIWELTEGCICCSTKGDFAASVLTIANAVDPAFLVVEPTGVGMPSNIIRNLRQIEYERITLLSPVTVVDGNSFGRYMEEYPELYRDQIQTASTILISKMEQADESERETLKAELQKWNPEAEIVAKHYTLMPDSWWKRLLENGFGKESTEEKDMGTLPDSFSLSRIHMDSVERLIILLENLIRGVYGDIVRAKGCVEICGQTVLFDVADGRYSIIGAESEMTGRVVFIGRMIYRQMLRKELFKKAEKRIVRKNK